MRPHCGYGTGPPGNRASLIWLPALNLSDLIYTPSTCSAMSAPNSCEAPRVYMSEYGFSQAVSGVRIVRCEIRHDRDSRRGRRHERLRRAAAVRIRIRRRVSNGDAVLQERTQLALRNTVHDHVVLPACRNAHHALPVVPDVPGKSHAWRPVVRVASRRELDERQRPRIVGVVIPILTPDLRFDLVADAEVQRDVGRIRQSSWT